MTTATRKAPAKKAPTKKAAVKRSPRAAQPAGADEELAAAAAALVAEQVDDRLVDEDGEIRPVIIGKRGRKGEDAPRMVTVFHLDDVDYRVPKEPSPALVLRFLRDLGTLGRDAAVERMAFTLLGEGALEALAASPLVEAEDVADVFTRVGVVFFGSEIYQKFRAATDPS